MERLLFIVNPLSGGKTKSRLLQQVKKHLRFPYSVCFTEAPGHATLLAAEAQADVVVAVGGDGTVNEVASGLMGSDKMLGILPCGSGDGLALHLGISRCARKAVGTLNRGEVQPMDCGLIDGKPFFCSAGMGLDADVAWRFASCGKRGLWTYIRLAWERWRDFEPQTYSIDVDGRKLETPAVIITAGNAGQWGNQARIADQASLQDGLLTLVVVKPFRTWEIPVLATKLLTGRAHTSRRVQVLTGRHIVIDRPAEGPVHYDGDPCLKGTHIEMEAVPSALKVITPPGKKI